MSSTAVTLFWFTNSSMPLLRVPRTTELLRSPSFCQYSVDAFSFSERFSTGCPEMSDVSTCSMRKGMDFSRAFEAVVSKSLRASVVRSYLS